MLPGKKLFGMSAFVKFFRSETQPAPVAEYTGVADKIWFYPEPETC
jgi:hypothetical protein